MPKRIRKPLAVEQRARKIGKDRERRARHKAASAESVFDRLMTIPAFIVLDDATQDALTVGVEAIVSAMR